MDELQQVINFTDADLKANVEGHLSFAQREKLHSRKERSLRLLVAVAGGISILLTIAILSGTIGIIVFGIMAFIMGVLALVEYMVGYQTYNRDLETSQIETIQGVVHYIWRGDSVMGIETRPSGIRVGDVQFLLMEDQARAFIEGEVYALYFAPATHTLLSAQQLILEDMPLASDAELAYQEESASQQNSMQ